MILFMVPSELSISCAALMEQVTQGAFEVAGLDSESTERIGLISPSSQHGREGVAYLEEMGTDPRDIVLVVMWGDTAESVGLEDSVSITGGVGFVALQRSGVILPVLRFPEAGDHWWTDPDNEAYAIEVYAEMIQGGRIRPWDGSTVRLFAYPHIWN